MKDTSAEFDIVASQCTELFSKKAHDYGTAWRILRTSSLTDQIFIKAHRIRNIQETGITKVDEGIIPEFIGIVNYSVMALIQLDIGINDAVDPSVSAEEAISLYTKHLSEAKSLMLDKNHDYGEAWRKMRISSLTDIILMKLLRIKQIEDHHGETLVSEGLAANYYDIVNYAIFALIRLVVENEQI